MKKIIGLFLISTLLFSIPAQASNDITVKIGGEVVQFDTQPQIINGRVYVPMRTIFEKLGATVEWNDVLKTINSKKDTTDVRLVIGENKITVNGKDITLDSPAKIINGKTLVPIRIVAESFNCDVKWNNETKIVSINTSEQVQSIQINKTTDYNITSEELKDEYYEIATIFIKERLKYPNTATFSARTEKSVTTSGNNNVFVDVRGYVTSQTGAGIMKQVPFSVLFDQERQQINMYLIDGNSDASYLLKKDFYQVSNSKTKYINE